jgi:hypothetical protein
MAKSLASFKERIHVNTHLDIKNYGKGRDYLGVVYSVNKTYFTVARTVTKEYYDEWSPKLRKGSFVAIDIADDPEIDNYPHTPVWKYFALSRIYWQPARHSRVIDDTTLEFLSYPEKLSSGRVVPAPFNNILVGQPWMTITLPSILFANRYW